MTETQFYSIKRNEDGDIVWLDDYAFMFNDEQIELLTDDDWQRYNEIINMEYC